MAKPQKKNTPKAILIDVIDPRTSEYEAQKRLEESENLTNTYGGIVVIKTIQKKSLPDYETYIGKGKVEELLQFAKDEKATLLIVNNILKPRQIYALNEKFREADVKVWDRVDLILKIFSKHAKSTEAKLQIELASIKHMGPRIFGMGIELSRQAGAMGVRAGQGESNIEMMKRHLRDQELNILKKLKHYEVIREGHRSRRRRNNYKTAALVGYTNAGKSSLLNALTNKGAYVADQLFATLDTRIGKLYIENPNTNEDGKYIPGREILISDTIGFIQELPPTLIRAFKSTLAETVESDMILHVIDVADPQIHKKIEIVEGILEQLGLSEKPKMYVFNKIDLCATSGVDSPIKSENDTFRHPCDPRHSCACPPWREDEKLPYKGIMKAGAETAKILGWASEEEVEQKLPSLDMAKLQKKYKKFTPTFISAADKLNLDKLKEIINKKTL